MGYKEKEKEEEKKAPTLQQDLDAISFRNEAISKINDLQNENIKLKDMMGRNKKSPAQSEVNIYGLRGLEGNLGRQFMKKTKS